MKCTLTFVLFLLFIPALSACLSPTSDSEVEEETYDFPQSYSGDPVGPAQIETPSGKWHSQIEVNGHAAWIIQLHEDPPEATWVAQWEPSTPGGYVAMTGVLLVSAYRDQLACLALEAWAEPSQDTIGRGGLIENCKGDPDADSYLIFIVETFGAVGTLDLLIAWGPGDTHHWVPRVAEEQITSTVEQWPLQSGQPLELDVDMGEYHGLHLVIPCHEDDPPGSLEVELGSRQPYILETNGVRNEEGRSRNWMSYGGIWTFPDEQARVNIVYEGSDPPIVGVLRSTTDWDQIFSTELGSSGVLLTYSGWCALQFRDEGPDQEPSGHA